MDDEMLETLLKCRLTDTLKPNEADFFDITEPYVNAELILRLISDSEDIEKYKEDIPDLKSRSNE